MNKNTKTKQCIHGDWIIENKEDVVTEQAGMTSWFANVLTLRCMRCDDIVVVTK